jgi:hypothetical protein
LVLLQFGVDVFFHLVRLPISSIFKRFQFYI